MKILHVVGARPNFMKAAPVMREMARQGGRFEQRLVHTGQHYDDAMSRVFLEELELPAPDANLGVGSGSHAEQTAEIMRRFEGVLLERRPDWLFVFGDVNSTLACALVAVKLGVRVAHVEAGLRSFDRSMPEEINRVVTDRIADLLFTPSADADENLLQEGVPAARIRRVGNVMIDALCHNLDKARARGTLREMAVERRAFVYVTLHRPSNVDDVVSLRSISDALLEVARGCPVVFAVHPRTRARLEANGMLAALSGLPRLRLIGPLGYLDSICLTDAAACVLTDSGGLQEETTYLGVPCVTLRPNTERPITLCEGTNRLTTIARLAADVAEAAASGGSSSTPRRPALWDGRAAGRIVAALLT